MDLYQQCQDLFARNKGCVEKDRGSCAKDFVRIAVGRDHYDLTRSPGRHPTFGLFPQGHSAGYGSFVSPDGTFSQHGHIGLADFGHIVSAGEPGP
jgi:hypothetical protein